MTKQKELAIYLAIFAVLIIGWFFAMFLLATFKANESLKQENYELLSELREC